MAEAQNLGINLDSKSIDILKKVDAIHRDSLINVGLQLVAKTGYFKTLAGLNNTEDLDDVASLDILEDGASAPKKASKKAVQEETKPKKPATTWDSF
jgi:hypothetical protein